jgi:hypothetical protein
VPSDDCPANEDRSGHPTSLRRALFFVLLGPVLGALVASSLTPDSYVIPIAYLFSLIVCALIGPIDGVLGYVLPIWLRAPLTAVAGAATAVGLYLFLIMLGNKTMPLPPLHELIPIALVGALSTGPCSLLTYCFRQRKA